MTKMIDETVVVIGGGAAGMMACGRLAERGKKVILIERNEILGRKVRITGKGRCNITNTADIEDIMQNIPTNSKFLYSALYGFTNDDVVEFFNRRGVATKTERGGRVFPESDKARDVAEALAEYALSKNTELVCARAKELVVKDGKICGVMAGGRKILADSVVIATGGKSYPLTGSTGDGYRIAEAVGHTIVPPRASLVPLCTKENWVRDVMGLSLKNVSLTLYDGKKKIYSDFGEMLFTHFGISGPIVLSASCHLKKIKCPIVSVDLKPALSIEQLDRRICRDFEKFTKKALKNSLSELLPKALIPVIINMSGISPLKDVSTITREERHNLASVMKDIKLTISGTRPIDEAIITSGGVKVSEINPSTMESKILPGLYFAGEVIDVDAYTGGFNLQIAFSTGRLAGENA